MNVFVLACGRFGRCLEKAGDKTRLNLTFGGMTLLERVVRMTRQHGHEPIVVTDEDVVEESIQHLGAETFRAPRGRSCVHSILDTRSLWDGHNVFLMGDVVYTRTAYGLSFRDHKGVCKVIGNHLEPFALTFGKTDEARVVTTLEETVAMMGLPAKPKMPACARTGKLAIFYRHWCGFDLGQNLFEEHTYIMVGGVTDLDAWYDVERVEAVLGVKAVQK